MDDKVRLAKIRRLLADPFSTYPELTPHESVVARLASRGETNVEIGKRLGINPHTAGSIVKRVSHKTGLRKHDLTRVVFEALDKILAQ